MYCLKYLHLDEDIFCRVRRLARCNDPESYAGGSVVLVGPPLPDRSKESTQTKRDTLVLQVGGWVDGPAPHHPEKYTQAKQPRQGIGKTDGLSNKRQKARKRLMNCGTWNVQGIRGKMAEITSELGKLKMDVIGLIETKRKGTGSEIVGGMFICIAEYRRTEEQKGEFPF